MLTVKFLLLIISTLVGYTLGFIFTEDEKFRLGKYRLFHFQAFECRPCLSFHITWVLTTLCSTLFEDWIMLSIGIVFAFILHIGLKIHQRNNTIKL